MGRKLFDYVIGNPPYQEEHEETVWDKPVYNDFMDATYSIADRVELITPARFLFDAGNTPSSWNRKMLNDEHLKVLMFEADSRKVFNNTDVEGGIVVTYRDDTITFGAIEMFTYNPALNSILKKVLRRIKQSLSVIMSPDYRLNLSVVYEDYPDMKAVIGSNGKEKRLVSNSFTKWPVMQLSPQHNDDIRILGIAKKGSRDYRWIASRYIEQHENLFKYKVVLPQSNGSAGQLGNPIPARIIGKGEIVEPGTAYTQTFLSIGVFDTIDEAQALNKYISTKFCRVMLGVLKVTPNYPPIKWKYVPLQDFTPSSDIDWSKSIHEIDLQLYRKYGLSVEEIEFIETHVKEMA